jgi:bla regulator protein blaR1
VLRPETREAPVYDLEAAKGGLRLTPSRIGNCVPVEGDSVPPPARSGEAPPTYCGNYNSGQGRLEVFGTRMQSFSFFLSSLMDRTVVDKTGFSGTFDIHLEYTPDQATADGPGQVPGVSADLSSPPSIFTALQEQMGLRLQSSRGPVKVLVIDHAEKPDAN